MIIVNGEALWVLDPYEIIIKEIDDGKKKQKQNRTLFTEYSWIFIIACIILEMKTVVNRFTIQSLWQILNLSKS